MSRACYEETVSVEFRLHDGRHAGHGRSVESPVVIDVTRFHADESHQWHQCCVNEPAGCPGRTALRGVVSVCLSVCHAKQSSDTDRVGRREDFTVLCDTWLITSVTVGDADQNHYARALCQDAAYISLTMKRFIIPYCTSFEKNETTTLNAFLVVIQVQDMNKTWQGTTTVYSAAL